uniref:Uncharacterized protein n=1 Tax=Solanum tuberosum TaxID=4113 RepID=M1DQN1_SOLTU
MGQAEYSPDVFTGMNKVFTFDVYALLDPKEKMGLTHVLSMVRPTQSLHNPNLRQGFRKDFKKRKEVKTGEKSRRSSSSCEIEGFFAKGLIPKRYLSSHSVEFVHPHANHVIFIEVSFLRLKNLSS